MIDSLAAFLGYGARGILAFTIILAATTVISFFMPDDVSYMGILIPLSLLKKGVMLGGLIVGFFTMVEKWVSDWHSGYIPHWYWD